MQPALSFGAVGLRLVSLRQSNFLSASRRPEDVAVVEELAAERAAHPLGVLSIERLGVFWHGHQVFDLYVTEKYRVLFVIDRDIVVSFSIGTHGIVSK